MPLVSSSVMAKRLGVARITVQRMARRGQIPALKVGPRLYRFDVNAVLAALQQERVNA